MRRVLLARVAPLLLEAANRTSATLHCIRGRSAAIPKKGTRGKETVREFCLDRPKTWLSERRSMQCFAFSWCYLLYQADKRLARSSDAARPPPPPDRFRFAFRLSQFLLSPRDGFLLFVPGRPRFRGVQVAEGG